MSLVGDLINTRELYRKRYVENYGWVTSSDSFFGRIQPKFSDAINRTYSITQEELFLNTAIFRDRDDNIGTEVSTTFTFPTSGEALLAAKTGVELLADDRIYEPESGRTWLIRSVAEYRDKELWHDEIITSEASQLDKKWIEPCEIYTLLGTEEFDPITQQYLGWNATNYAVSSAFGCAAAYDTERYTRDSLNYLNRSAKGKSINEPLLFYMDEDFYVDENSIIYMRGVYWKIEFIRESFFRVHCVGIKPYKERGINEILINRPRHDRII
jgi:hypothetical protein